MALDLVSRFIFAPYLRIIDIEVENYCCRKLFPKVTYWLLFFFGGYFSSLRFRHIFILRFFMDTQF